MRSSFQYPLLDRILRDGVAALGAAGAATLKLFQYPLLDRILRDSTIRPFYELFSCLSVSTIGSNTPRRPPGAAVSRPLPTFQYPLLDRILRDGASQQSVRPRGLFQYPLLDRILRDIANRRDFCPQTCFQYPLLDRILRDEVALFPNTDFDHLSVSTIGSNTPRPAYSRIRRSGISTFQYPLLDRILRDQSTSAEAVLAAALSVSTIGSNTPRLRLSIRPGRPRSCFQYPLLDRILRDGSPHRHARSQRALSVSTIGSNTPRRGNPCHLCAVYGVLSVSTIGSNTPRPLGTRQKRAKTRRLGRFSTHLMGLRGPLAQTASHRPALPAANSNLHEKRLDLRPSVRIRLRTTGRHCRTGEIRRRHICRDLSADSALPRLQQSDTWRRPLVRPCGACAHQSGPPPPDAAGSGK